MIDKMQIVRQRLPSNSVVEPGRFDVCIGLVFASQALIARDVDGCIGLAPFPM